MMTLYVIYSRPTDYPHGFPVRRHVVVEGIVHARDLLGVGKTLDEARRFVPAGMFNIGRVPNDDPVIVEVWI
jgi:hypothetical protein